MALTRLGQSLLVGGNFANDNALFLKVFSGLVLKYFNETKVFENLHTVRRITSGKTAQFPITGTTTAEYHVPGTPIAGNQIQLTERTINIDDLLISHTSIYNLDEAKAHYEVRSEFARQMGEALSRRYDINVAKLIALAARAPANIPGITFGGTVLNAGATVETDGTVLAQQIFNAVTALDEKNIPESERYCVVRPAQYYRLVQATDNINKDWGGAGAYSDGKVFRIGGVPIIKSNNIPTGDIGTNAGENNLYSGNFNTTVALVFHKAAVGTVRLRDMRMQMTDNDYRVQNQADLMVASYACGHGILRPECAVEITSAP